jgi:hypothetical protein
MADVVLGDINGQFKRQRHLPAPFLGFGPIPTIIELRLSYTNRQAIVRNPLDLVPQPICGSIQWLLSLLPQPLWVNPLA